MIKHTQLNPLDFNKAILNTKTFNGFEKFKQAIVSNINNLDRLYDYYHQACKWGIPYLKQNQNIFANDVKMIEEVLET